MSKDQYSRRLEDLFSTSGAPSPEPARPPEHLAARTEPGKPNGNGRHAAPALADAAVAKALQARVAELEVALAAARAGAEAQPAAGQTALFSAISDLILVYDADGRYLEIIPTDPAMLYKPVEAMLGKTMHEVLPTAKADELLAHVRRALADGRAHHATYSLIIDGREQWFEAAITPRTAQTVYWVAHDITARRQADRRLQESEARYRSIVESTSELIQSVDADGHFIFVNAAWRATLGYSDEDLARLTLIQVLHPESRALGQSLLARTWRGEPVHDAQLVLVAKNGARVEVVGDSAPRLVDGRVAAVQSIWRDITAERQVELDLLQFRHAFERSTDAIFLTGLEGQILFVNDAFTQTYGYTREEALGKTPRLLKSGVIPPEQYAYFWQTLLNKQVVAGEIVNKTKDGRLIPVEGANSPILDSQGNLIGFMAVHRDISARKQAEQAVAQQTAELATLNELSQALAVKTDLEATLKLVGEKVTQIFRARGGFIALYDEDTRIITWPYFMEAGRVADVPPTPLGRGPTSHVIETRQTLVINQDIDARMHAFGARRTSGTSTFEPRSWIGLPLLVGDRVVGVMSAGADVENRFSADDVRLLSTIAANVGAFIQKAQLFDQIRRRATELTAINNVLAASATTLDLAEILHTAAVEIAQLVQARNCGIALLNAAHTHLHVVADHAVDGSPSAVGIDLPLEGNRSSQLAIDTRRSMIIENAQTDPLTAPIHALMRARNTYGLVIVPLVSRNTVIGTLAIDGDDPQRRFTPADAAVLETIANQLAGAVENSRLFEQTQKRASELEALNRIGQVLTSAQSQETVLRQVGDEIRQIMNVTTSFIALVDEARQHLTLPYCVENGEYVEAPASPLGQGLTAEVLQTRAPILRHTRAGHTAGLHSGRSPAAASWLGVPIFAGDEAIGVLNVQDQHAHRFTDDDQRLLSTIASSMGTALQNARLFQQTRERARQLEETTRFLDSVVDNLPAMLFVKDAEELRFVRWNKTGERLLGFSNESMLGKNDADLFPPDRADLLMAQDRQVLASGELSDVPEEPTTTANGERRYLHTRKIPILDAAGVPRYLLGISEDITERKRVEAALARRAKELEALNGISQALATQLDLAAVLQLAGHKMLAAFGVDTGFIALVNTAKGTLQLPYYLDGGQPLDLPERPIGVGLTSYVIRERRPVRFDRLAEEAAALGLTPVATGSPEAQQSQSWLGVPMLKGATVIGVLNVQALPAYFFTDADMRLMSTIAATVGAAVENARLFNQTQKRAADLATVNEVSVAATTILEPQTMLQQVVDLTRERFGLYHAHLYLLNEVGDTLVLAAGAGEPGRQMLAQGWSIALSREQSLVARAARSRFGVTVNDVTTEPGFLPNPLLPATRAEMAIPLIAGDHVLGVLDVQADEAGRFGQEDVTIHTTLAAQVAAALQNARSFEQTQRLVAELNTVTRRLVAEGWQAYETRTGLADHAYLYDLSQLRRIEAGPQAHPPADDQVSAPLSVQGTLIGELTMTEAALPAEEAREIVVEVAGRLSAHLENLRLNDEMQANLVRQKRLSAELETVAQVTSVAATILERNELLQQVVDLTKGRFGLYHAHIYLYDELSQTLQLAAGAGAVGAAMVAEGRMIPLMLETSIVATAARTRQPMIVADTQVSATFLPHPLLPHTRSELAVPMIAGDQLVGVLDVQADAPGRFTDEDVRIKITLAGQVAIAIQNANLYTEQAATVARLKDLDQLKSSFLANMSHELRTPLNSILGFTDVILEGLDGPLTDRMDNDLKVVQKNGHHLLGLINDILDMAKIEAGRMTLNPERFNLVEILDEVVDITGSLAREKKLALKTEIASPYEDLDLDADHVRVRQVLINLVGNATKFTEKGSITLRASREGENVLICVRDTGIGIPPEKLETVFEAFSQVDTSTTRKSGGTGLGLPISRNLIELHGGRLWAESTGQPGSGSRFYVELPVEFKQAQPVPLR